MVQASMAIATHDLQLNKYSASVRAIHAHRKLTTSDEVGRIRDARRDIVLRLGMEKFG